MSIYANVNKKNAVTKKFNKVFKKMIIKMQILWSKTKGNQNVWKIKVLSEH